MAVRQDLAKGLKTRRRFFKEQDLFMSAGGGITQAKKCPRWGWGEQDKD